ncbi:hypothetical protein RRG08_040007 [Elysia crispata]|uniref:Uncharacterized protein n=1 Tax=Elysia crispata TaxID=231223 RepID=A0AAE0Z9C2_9GAST|nr:hypothetical protein RRG08_040007 [Elysia crispata]
MEMEKGRRSNQETGRNKRQDRERIRDKQKRAENSNLYRDDSNVDNHGDNELELTFDEERSNSMTINIWIGLTWCDARSPIKPIEVRCRFALESQLLNTLRPSTRRLHETRSMASAV